MGKNKVLKTRQSKKFRHFYTKINQIRILKIGNFTPKTVKFGVNLPILPFYEVSNKYQNY